MIARLPQMESVSSDNTRQRLWSWYVRSSRRDGARVSPGRQLIELAIGFAALVATYHWMTKSAPWTGDLCHRLLVKHPLFVAGEAISFYLMCLRSSALDYAAYSVYEAQHISVPEKIFGNERELYKKYEESFGRDWFRRMPETCAVLSLIVFFLSGLALILSQR